MSDPHPLSSLHSFKESWLNRVRENLHQLLVPARIFPSSANGAPLHLLTFKRAGIVSGSRTVSFLSHAAVLAGVILLNVSSRAPRIVDAGPEIPSHGPFTFFPVPDENRFGRASLGKKSGGGEEDLRPAKHGLLAPSFSIPLVPPRRTLKTNPDLPVPASVVDPNAPQFPAPVTILGIPWMKNDSDSAGPGRKHGFGSGTDGGMGDDKGPGAGQGEAYDGSYSNLHSPPSCAYCPDPQYTDEAREAKLQGRVTLQVLVGADGRASQIRVVQGIGLGLDERALEAIRGWKFIPARDAGHRGVPAWVTVEAVFRLF
ncbi:MAG TPA: energy transducer TonB [Candidatus Acidoferrum sp.]|jgi:TonB family protein|nr:energy transducer TonB [Candidatus Acidoferrum sp.]